MQYARPGDILTGNLGYRLLSRSRYQQVTDLGRTIERHYPDPERKITDWARRFLSQHSGATDTEEFLLAVTHAIREEFDYQTRFERGVQSPVETLERSTGSCRDYALFMMEVVRSVA